MFDKLLVKYQKNRYQLFYSVFYLFFFIEFLFSSNYLEEDLIIGLFSNIILFGIVFFIREFKSIDIRLNRKRIKLGFRIQKKLLKSYYFFFFKFIKRYYRYFRKLSLKYFFINCIKLFLIFGLKRKFFYNKLLYMKIYFFNILIFFILKFNLNFLNLLVNK